MDIEIDNIKKRYEKRTNIEFSIYNPLNPSVYMSQQELERVMLKWFNKNKLSPLANKKLLEVGCGTGSNLAKFIKYGFIAENLIGNELLSERVELARNILPVKLKIIEGDASSLKFEKNYFDIIFQSTVFSSILDNELKNKIAKNMWNWLKPGGFILWYDFIYDNPNNKDVRGVKVQEIKSLFPEGIITYQKVTLAPPINRIITKFNPNLYHVFNAFKFLRTHILCSIQKIEE